MNPHVLPLPVLLPMIAALLGLFVRAWRPAQVAVTLLGMAGGLAVSTWLLLHVWAHGPVVLQMGAWAAPMGISFVADLLSVTMVFMVQLVMMAGIIYAVQCRDQCARYPAFLPLMLLLGASLTGAMITGDTFNFFVFAELLVITGCVLTAISDDKNGTESAYKYFYISTFSAVSLLLGNGCFYAAYGSLNMADLAVKIGEAGLTPVASCGVAMFIVALCIKSAVPPFHFWQPDFHTVAPTAVSAMLSSIVVKVGVYGFLRFTTLLMPTEADSLRQVLLVLGILGGVVGSFGAIGTHNLKRVLAYSTLSQIGFILVAIGWGSPAALAAAVVFTFNHSLIKSAMLMLAGAVAARAPVKSASFDVITGVGKVMPLAGILFAFGGMALAGMPPMNGFVAKLGVFRAGAVEDSLIPLALLGVLSVFTLIYVWRSFMQVWFNPMPEGGKCKPYGDSLLAPALLVILCLVLGVWPQPLLQLAGDCATWMVDGRADYIRAVLVEVAR